MLEAGSVITILAGKFDSAEFGRFDAANKQSARVATESEARISAAQARLNGALGRTAQAQERATAASRRGALAQSEQSVALARTEAEMASLEKTIKSSGVATKIQAAELDRLTKQHAYLSSAIRQTADQTTLLDKYGSQASKNLGTLGRVGAKTAAVGLLSLAGATIYAVKKAGDFEKQMRNVNSIAKLSEADYRHLSQSVLDLAGKTAQSPKVLAEGLYSLVSSGFNASDSLKILQASAFAATAGLTTTEVSAKAVSAVLNAYRLPASQAGHVSDVLFETVNRGVLTFEELSKSIGDVLPFAAALGVQLPEVGAAVSTMTKEGINAPETMTRLRRVIQSFIKPSKDMSAAIKETGASSAEALVHQRGLEGAVAAVIKTTDGQKTSIAKLFPDIRALGGALALTGKNAKGAQQDLKAFQDTAGATQKVFHEQAKGAEFAGKELVSSIESGAIAIGDKFLPMLAHGAQGLAQALQQAAKDGTLTNVAHDMLSVFSTLGTAAGDIAPPLEHIAGAFVDIGKGLGLTNPDELAALAAGFLAFKGAAFVTPILLAAAGALKLLWTAVAEEGLAVIPKAAGLWALANPVTAIAAAAGLAAAAFMALKGHEESEAKAAEHVTQAKEAEAQAISAVHDAVLAEADATFGAAKADTELDKAKRHLADVAKQYGKKSSQYKQVLDEEREAALRDAEAHDRLKKAHEQVAKANKKATEEAHERVKTARELFKAEFGSLTNKVAHGEINQGEFRQGLISSLEKYNAAVQDAARGTAVAAISQIQLDRVLQGQPLLADNAASAVAKLTTVWGQLTEAQQKALAAEPGPALSEIGELVGRLHGVSVQQKVQVLIDAKGAQAQIAAFKAILGGIPAAKVIQILTSAHTAGEQVAALRALLAGVPPQKVLRIIHNAGSAKAAIQQLGAAARALPPSRSIDITTNAHAAEQAIDAVQAAVGRLHGTQVAINILETVNRVTNRAKGHASGRRAGASETALVGEGAGPEYVVDANTGRGQVVSRPTFMGLSPSDYVIPTEDRFRGRGIGLWMMLGRDLGIPGYRSGRKGEAKHHGGGGHQGIPDAIEPHSLPLNEIEQKQQKAHERYEKAASKVRSLEGKVHTAEGTLRRASPKSRAKDHAKLVELQKELRKARSSKAYRTEHLKEQEWARTLREAKAFQAKIDRETQEANIARNEMQLADNRGDGAGFQRAKSKRLAAINALKALYEEAKRHAIKVDPAYARELTEKIQGQELEGEEVGRGEEPALTPEQEHALKSLEANVSLAALTPGLADDTSAAQQLVGFLEGALGQAEAAHAGPSAIKELADQVATARSNLQSLTGGGGSNENADVQAQIEQQKQRTEAAEQRAETAERALRVLGGPGDIGSGGANASAAVIQHNYMLHPSDPAVLKTIGEAATAGIDYQGGRRSPRIRVGPP
jgi:TP901 family phage tail tape measure protein